MLVLVLVSVGPQFFNGFSLRDAQAASWEGQ